MAFVLLMMACVCLGQVRAGAAKRTVTPDLKAHAPVYIGGFGQNRVATAIHDDLWARCMALEAGGRTVVLCGVDSVGLFYDDIQRIRVEAAKRLKRPADVVVTATHNHEAPDTMGLWGPSIGVSGVNDAYMKLLTERTVEAIVAAVKSVKPARLTFAHAHTPELDAYIADNRPPVVHDSELIMLRATGPGNEQIGTLLNWANHPEALGSKNTLITADYVAALYTRLEEQLGGVAVFINGAVGGMQSPLNAKIQDPKTGQPAPAGSFRKAEIVGVRAAEIAAAAVLRQKPIKVDRLSYREKLVEIPVTNTNFRLAAKLGLFKGRQELSSGSSMNVPVGVLRLSWGERPILEAALVPGELYPELSVGGVERYAGADFPDAAVEPAIKRMMTAPYRMLFGMANDMIGYIIPLAEWDEKTPWLQNAEKRWYGEVNSVGPEAAPRIAAALRELLHTH